MQPDVPSPVRLVRYEVEPSDLPDAPWQCVRVYSDGRREVGGRYGSKSAASRYANWGNKQLGDDRDA